MLNLSVYSNYIFLISTVRLGCLHLTIFIGRLILINSRVYVDWFILTKRKNYISLILIKTCFHQSSADQMAPVVDIHRCQNCHTMTKPHKAQLCVIAHSNTPLKRNSDKNVFMAIHEHIMSNHTKHNKHRPSITYIREYLKNCSKNRTTYIKRHLVYIYGEIMAANRMAYRCIVRWWVIHRHRQRGL